MKNVLLFTAVAIPLLSACTKMTTIDNGAAQEISYQFVKANMVTKANIEYSGTFQSWAYYLATGTWSYGTTDAQAYLTDVKIEKIGTTWKNANTSYYWPKVGSLSFFALAPSTLSASATRSCSVDHGVTVSDFTASNNAASQIDLMVADLKADQTTNNTVGSYYTTGVPTLFKHKLTKVAISVRTADDYGDSYKVTIISLALKNVKSKGNYTQYPEAWSVPTTVKDYTFSAPSGTLTSTPVLTPEAYLMIPQSYANMGDAKIVVSYSISMKGSSTITVAGTKEIVLSTQTTSNWDMNKFLVYKLTFSPEEILWDPAVHDWEASSNVNVAL